MDAASMTREEIKEALLRYKASIPWKPQDGPQWSAFHSQADVLLYGGAAGGGKTSLAVGLSLTLHSQTLFIRREAKQLAGVIDHVAELIDPMRAGYSGQTGEWNLPQWDGVKRKLVLGSTKNPGDEMKFQGRPRDLLVIDEAANMLETQVRFLMGWVRTTTPGQRTRTLLCSNPPTTAEGYWLTEMFAPWLDPTHPNPARPGELRYFTVIDGKEVEFPSGDPVPNPNPAGEDDQWLYPKSYSFIPAKVGDNKFLGTDYLRELQALPEPLRSQMLLGDFTAGQDDGEWQVIPSDWVRQAQARWTPECEGNITSVGVDPSRGGRDQTVIASRKGWWFAPLLKFDGEDMKTGNDVAAKVIELAGHTHSPFHVDVIGIGASVVDSLDMFVPGRTIPCNVATKSTQKDWSGSLTFSNLRAELWWGFRDLLNPANAQNIALPPDNQLFAELCTPTYSLTPSGIKVESKQEIIKRLGRSTDCADAVLMCAQRGSAIQIEGYTAPPVNVIGSMRR